MLSFVAGFSFGLFVLPVFLAALIAMLVSRRPGDLRPPQSAGVLLGFALVGVLVLTLNPDWWQLIPVSTFLALLAIALPVAMRQQDAAT